MGFKKNKKTDVQNVFKLSQLKVLSWNIQSSNTITGNKFEDPSFTKVFKNHHIMCLQEIRQAIKLPGYRSICKLRKNMNSGGVGILFKNELAGGITQVKKHNISDVIICKLKKSFFRLKQDIYLVNTYIKPSSSANKNNEINGRDTIKQLEDTLNNLRDSGEVILCGDFNSRISDHPGLIEHETDHIDEYIPLPDDYIPDNFSNRCSEDRQTNAYYNDFLSLVINNKFVILNGRTLGDYGGAFTCIHYNGSSVVDYFMVTSSINSLVNHMKVLEFTEFSDHKPLSLTLTSSHINLPNVQPLDAKYNPAPTRFIINDDNKQKFIEIQQDDTHSHVLDDLDSTIDKSDGSQTGIDDINERYCKYLHDMASECFKTTKHNVKKKKKNNPWFNRKCWLAKRELNKATRVTSKFPSSDFLRQNYYKVKNNYKRILKSEKNNFFNKLNTDIEDGKVLNWQQFKKLKSHQTEKINFDSLDMTNFKNFFAKLYSDEHKTIDNDSKIKYLATADEISSNSKDSAILNDEISIIEVKKSISSLKSGKASSTDMISNEILKSLDGRNITFLTKLYNTCLESGNYPWNCSVITPLHKKGDRENPDNYRAIAVSSVIGKLFSTILLDRFIQFRKLKCPDPPNQLGFTKNAQTYDHIFTLQTIASKYKKMRKTTYAVFVDFRKAFDTVCRQALLYKLAKNGFTGKFYNILKTMYSNSSAHIKLSGYLSDKFQIKKGTEQGHPLSPDLFKLFLSDLSSLLNFKNCPTLSNMLVSHLLWADDLILLSLDQHTAQSQLDQLTKFCNDWGIEINQDKTKLIIFGNNTNAYPKLYLNNQTLEIVDSYCYLGIVIHKSGKLKEAKDNLKNKAMRAFFGLKRTVNKLKLSFRALTTLFDSLIKPIVLYGAPIWTPTSSIIKNLTKAILNEPRNFKNIISKINRTLSEKVHLSFLKWALGVHRKASNIGTWGESGRYPLIYQSIKLTLNYFQRINDMSPGSFVHAALQEQKLLKLDWYKNIESLLKIDEIYHLDHVTAYKLKHPQHNQNNDTQSHNIHNTSTAPSTSPNKHYSPSSQILLNHLSKFKVAKPLPSKQFRLHVIHKHLRDHFRRCWELGKATSPKLEFYHSNKINFAKETYLDVIKNPTHRYRITRLRISAHDFEIERGRYSQITRDKRTCKWCLLTLNSEFIEDEPHVLFNCDLHANMRSKFINTMHQLKSDSTFKNCDTTFIHNLTIHNLHIHFMTLLSPNTVLELDRNDPFCRHHDFTSITSDEKRANYSDFRSYIINSIGSFVNKCFDNRANFKEQCADQLTDIDQLQLQIS